MKSGRRRRSDPSWHLSNNVPSSTLTIFWLSVHYYILSGRLRVFVLTFSSSGVANRGSKINKNMVLSGKKPVLIFHLNPSPFNLQDWDFGSAMEKWVTFRQFFCISEIYSFFYPLFANIRKNALISYPVT